MSIQNVDSAPDYIMKFIHGNMEQLCKIYETETGHQCEFEWSSELKGCGKR